MKLQKIINFEVNNILIEFKTKFNLKYFKSIETQNEKIRYASNHLDILGVGSSRIVFLLSNRFVLKIAKRMNVEKGIVQNKTEVELYTQPKTKPLMAKVYDFADDYIWIISELVRPLKNKVEFEKLTNVKYSLFDDILFDMIKQHLTTNLYNNLHKMYTNKSYSNELEALENNIFLQNVLILIEETNLLPGDVSDNEHWGKTADGRIVLLDYGATQEVYNKYYK